MIKLVVFDIAGTTLQDDNVVGTAFTNAFKTFGITPKPEHIDEVMGLSKPVSIKIILDKFGCNLAVNEVHQEFLHQMIEYYQTSPDVKEVPRASEIFGLLHEYGCHVALDTGFSHDITDVIMERTGWIKNKLVDGAVSSDQVSEGRPYPYMIFKLMEQFKIANVQQVMKVGDTPADINEGLNAGCHTVGIYSGHCNIEQLAMVSSSKYDLVKDITEIPFLNY